MAAIDHQGIATGDEMTDILLSLQNLDLENDTMTIVVKTSTLRQAETCLGIQGRMTETTTETHETETSPQSQTPPRKGEFLQTGGKRSIINDINNCPGDPVPIDSDPPKTTPMTQENQIAKLSSEA
jgi:hypothetical protein